MSTADAPGGHRIVLVDDEPLITARLSDHLTGTLTPPTSVRTVDRPRRLASLADLGATTHAVVDLSFGRYDFDRAELAPELETGADAIALLVDRGVPAHRIVVASRLDTEFLEELAVAIRQTWPQVRFLHKADERLAHRVERFVADGAVRDNAEVALVLAGVVPRSPSDIAACLGRVANPGAALLIVRALADEPNRPSADELAAALARSTNFVRRVVQEIGDALKSAELLPADGPSGLARLWPWARARRAVLHRLD